jgi:hypothetical protein
MKSMVIIVFGVMMIIMSLSSIFGSIDDARANDYSQTVSGVATGAGVYAANVSLGQGVYGDTVGAIKSISSNQSSDSPSAYSFNSVSNVVWVAGLDAGLTRTLDVEFKIDDPNLEAGQSGFLTLFRWFYLFIGIGLTVGAIYNFFGT